VPSGTNRYALQLFVDPSLLNVGIHTCEFKLSISGSNNYENIDSNTISCTVDIRKASLPTTMNLSVSSWSGPTQDTTYSQVTSLVSISNLPPFYNTGSGHLQYSITAEEGNSLSIDSNTGQLTLSPGASAGAHNYTIQAQLQDDGNYNGTSVSGTFTYYIGLPSISYYFNFSSLTGNEYNGRLFVPYGLSTYTSFTQDDARNNIISSLVSISGAIDMANCTFSPPTSPDQYGNFNATFTANSAPNTKYQADSTATIPCTNAFSPIMIDNNHTLGGSTNVATTDQSSSYQSIRHGFLGFRRNIYGNEDPETAA
jgi:hypothetical protein